MSEYYDGAKLLSLKDLNGDTPEIYICTTNRSAGKTTYFNRLCVNAFIKRREKFCLIYRYSYELSDIADKFFKDIKSLFFNNWNLTAESRAKGSYYELYLSTDSENKGEPCGYAVALNKADQIKKYSHLLSDTSRMLFDEFQSETNNYCSNEVQKLISVHTSIARGGGQHVRYVPLYMLSNSVSIINPYYTELGISARLNTNTKFLRGIGWVLEQGYLEQTANLQKSSAFNRAFATNSYVAYSTENVYLNDNLAFVEKPTGKSRYLATIRYNGKDYALREYPDEGVIYCDNNADSTFPNRLAVTTNDHQINYVMIRSNPVFISNMRYFFEKGCFRFKDLSSKEALMTAISY